MALNYIWLGFFLIGFAAALARAVSGDTAIFGALVTGVFDTAGSAVTISLGLAGVMSFWLGMLKVGEAAGLVQAFARGVAPLFRHLYPGVPRDHPAAGAIAMNFGANLLGLDNAATPIGLTAMRELQSLNAGKPVASDAMIMFLVLNTAGLTLIPSSVMAIRAALAVEQGLSGFNAADIFVPTLAATFISFSAGLVAVAAVQRISLWRAPILAFLGAFAALLAATYLWLGRQPPEQAAAAAGALGGLLVLAMIAAFLVAGALRRINVYETFVDGARDGFVVAVRIIPYLVAMLAAISVFRTSGCMDAVVGAIAALATLLQLPTDFVPALPVGLMKSLSGSGARALMIDVMKTWGVDSFQGRLACIIQGSTETTFYVLAVYFGSVGITRARHAIACGLIADAVGLVGAIVLAYAFYR